MNTVKLKVTYYTSLVCTSIIILIVIYAQNHPKPNNSLITLGVGAAFVMYYLINSFMLLKKNNFTKTQTPLNLGMTISYGVTIFNGWVFALAGVVSIIMGIYLMNETLENLLISLYGITLCIFAYTIIFYSRSAYKLLK